MLIILICFCVKCDKNNYFRISEIFVGLCRVVWCGVVWSGVDRSSSQSVVCQLPLLILRNYIHFHMFGGAWRTFYTLPYSFINFVLFLLDSSCWMLIRFVLLHTFVPTFFHGLTNQAIYILARS